MSAVSSVPERCPVLARVAAPTRHLSSAEHSSTPVSAPAGTESSAAAMLQTFEEIGGLARSDEVLSMLRQHTSQPLSVLARRIAKSHIVTFEWQAERYVPLFQFEIATMSIRPAVALVLAELEGIFDDWEVAAWFVEPNTWLYGSMPVEVIGLESQAVLNAARADRFVARG